MSEGKRSFSLSSDDRTNNDPRGSVNERPIRRSKRDTRAGSRGFSKNSRVIYTDRAFVEWKVKRGPHRYRCSNAANVKVSCHEATTGTSDNFYHAHTPLAIMPFYCKIFLMFFNMCRLRQATAFSRQFLPSTIIAKDKSVGDSAKQIFILT